MLHVSEPVPVMFGGYADVAAYYYDADLQANTTEDGGIDLPAEYNPVWRMPDPWHRDSQCQSDFILVAEFSELEGPKPLITIPKHPDGNFDLNEFSVRIMSVDSQSQPSDAFRVHSDTSVLMSEAKNHVYAYVHNITLYDSKARGFVRPFCLAYVTADYAKLQYFCGDIEHHFNQVSQTFKEGNLSVFIKDMTHHLSDLHYTKERFCEREASLNLAGNENTQDKKSRSEDDLILESLTEDSLATALKEVKHILRTVSNLMNDTDNSYALDESQASISEPEANGDSSQDFLSEVIRPCHQLNRSGETQLSSSFQYTCSISEQPDTRQMRRWQRSGSFSEYVYQNSSHSDSHGVEHYQPKLVRTTNKRRYDKTLRTLHELCLAHAKKGLNRLRFVHKYFAKDLSTLKLEKRESEVLFPNKGLLTLGRNVQLNFLPEDLSSGLKASKSAHSDIFSDETASYASAESFLSCEDTSQSKPALILSSSLEDLRWANNSSPNSSVTAFDANSLVTLSIDGSCTDTNGVHTVNPTASLTGSVTDSTTNSLESSEGDHRMFNVAAGDDFTTSLGASEVGSTVCSDLLYQPVKVFCFADQLHSLSKSTPGYGLLKFMESYSFSQHVLFSLLCGRSVVVIVKPSKEETARALLNTLSFFLTSSSGEYSTVAPLYKAMLTAEDLKKKLVGIVRATRKLDVLPKHLEQTCSVLDLDHKVFSGPCYLGGVLTEVYSRRKVHSTDSTYLAYIHVILQEIAMKAYVFYHTFIQNVAAKLPHMYSKHDEAKIAYRKAEQHFLSRMKMSAHDTEMVKYLAEVMQKQINGEGLDLTDISTSTVDKIPCQTFKQ